MTPKKKRAILARHSSVVKSLKLHTGELFFFNVWPVFSGWAEVLGRLPGGPVIRNLLFVRLNGGVTAIPDPESQGAATRKPENHARCTGAPDDSKLISLSISWIRVQSSRCVRCELPWAGGREFHRGVLRFMLSMKSCGSLPTHRVWPLGNAIQTKTAKTSQLKKIQK